jgi:F0F1-type ATP synthase membrane subunit c/vacuolar-type H+-ATPase subunit K
MTYVSDAAAGSNDAARALADAEDAIREGDRRRAYQLSLKVLQMEPQNQIAWLLRAQTAPSIEEAVQCLNHAAGQPVLDAEGKQAFHRTVQRILEADPFLLYLDETDGVYRVRSSDADGRVLHVPKDRRIPEPYPVVRPASLQKAYRWLWWAFLGLPLAGLGAVVFAPLAAGAAMSLYLRQPSGKNRILSLVVILLAGGLWLVGLLLGVILLMHLISR